MWKARRERKTNDQIIKEHNERKRRRRIALKSMVSRYSSMNTFTRDACDLGICLTGAEARRLYQQLKED